MEWVLVFGAVTVLPFIRWLQSNKKREFEI
jgi:hypothetical protein